MAAQVRITQAREFLEKASLILGPEEDHYGNIYIVFDRKREEIIPFSHKLMDTSSIFLNSRTGIQTRQCAISVFSKIQKGLQKIRHHFLEEEVKKFRESFAKYTQNEFVADFDRPVTSEDCDWVFIPSDEDSIARSSVFSFVVKEDVILKNESRSYKNTLSTFNPFIGITTSQLIEIDFFGVPYVHSDVGPINLDEFAEDFMKMIDLFTVEIISSDSSREVGFEGMGELDKLNGRQIIQKIIGLYLISDRKIKDSYIPNIVNLFFERFWVANKMRLQRIERIFSQGMVSV